MIGTVALLVVDNQLKDTLTDSAEIGLLEALGDSGTIEQAQAIVRQYRKETKQLEERLGDHVEEILVSYQASKEAKKNAMDWMKSHMKLEQYRKEERQAAAIIGEHAFSVFQTRPDVKEFILQAETSQVRVVIFSLKRDSQAA